MTAQHTPGPWPAPEHDSSDTSANEWYDIPGVCRMVYTEADANLIAAAPDLLEAATSARAMFRAIAARSSDIGFHASVFAGTLTALQAAIAKAEGEKA
jgi:hypothetical protein